MILSGLLGAAILAPLSAHASAIGIGAFSGSATVIDFDSLGGTPDIGTGELVTSQYAGQGVIFGNAAATANSFLGSFFPGTSAPNVVFVEQGGGGPLPPLSIFFSVPVNRVGMNFGSSGNSFFTMAAYDSSNTLIESHDFVGLPDGNLQAGFAGLEETTPVARVDLSYHPSSRPSLTYNFSIDNLRFDQIPVSHVPEPSSLALAALALVGLGLAGPGACHRRRCAGSAA